MSIIYDALKKVQEKTRSDEKKSAEPISGAVDINTPVAVQESRTGSSTDIPRPIMATILTIISIAVIVVFAILFRLARQTTVHPEMIATANTNSPTPSNLSLQPQDATPIVLKLEGIMNMEDKKVALINGLIYEEGQILNGKTITAITETGVTFQENGTEEVLRISQ